MRSSLLNMRISAILLVWQVDRMLDYRTQGRRFVSTTRSVRYANQLNLLPWLLLYLCDK